MIDFDFNTTICFEQQGHLTGAETGRCYAQLTFASTAVVYVQAFSQGLDWEGAQVITVQGNGPTTTVNWLQLSLIMTVILGVGATAQDVADAINAAVDPLSGQLSPFRAAAPTLPGSTASATSATFVGGADPTTVDSGRFAYYTNGVSNVGLFNFNHKAGAFLVRQVVGFLGAGTTGTISTVTLDSSLVPIAATSIIIARFTTTSPTYEFGLVDTHIPLLPKMALVVTATAGAVGYVRVYARKEGLQTTT